MMPRSLGIQRPGGYGDHVLVPHTRYLIPLGPLKPEEAAPYACSGLATFGALRKLGSVIERQPIVIALADLRAGKAIGRYVLFP